MNAFNRKWKKPGKGARAPGDSKGSKGGKGDKGGGKGGKGGQKGDGGASSPAQLAAANPGPQVVGSKSFVGCFICGSKDHYARDCPSKGKAKGKAL